MPEGTNALHKTNTLVSRRRLLDTHKHGHEQMLQACTLAREQKTPNTHRRHLREHDTDGSISCYKHSRRRDLTDVQSFCDAPGIGTHRCLRRAQCLRYAHVALWLACALTKQSTQPSVTPSHYNVTGSSCGRSSVASLRPFMHSFGYISSTIISDRRPSPCSSRQPHPQRFHHSLLASPSFLPPR